MTDMIATPSSSASSSGADAAGARLQTLLASFRQIGMPLMQAMAEASAPREGFSEPTAMDASQFQGLVDSTVAFASELSDQAGVAGASLDAGARWALASSAAQVVAASFRATGKPLVQDEAKRLAEMAVALEGSFKGMLPAGGQSPAGTVAMFRAKMMEAMVPVIGAVAQYAFGRAEHELLGDIAARLVKMADQVTRTLAAPGSTPEQWRLLCWSVLRAAGQIYTECHYAEADRLLYMDPDQRAAYFAQHGTEVPMTQLWQAFAQRMAMLATLATYLDVPATAQLDEGAW